MVACSPLGLFTLGSATDRGDVKYSHEEKGDFVEVDYRETKTDP